MLPTRGVRAAGLGARARAWPGTRGCAGRGPGGSARGGCRRRRRRGCRRGRRGRRFRGCHGPRAPRAWARRLRGRGLRRGGLGRRAVAVGLDLLRGRLRAAERFAQPARDGRLDCGGRGFDEFALFAKPGEDFLAGDTEFFCQLVYAGLTCHYISSLGGDSGGRRRASGLAMTHGHRDFTVCSCSSLPVLLPGRSSRRPPTALKRSITAVMSGEPVMRSARTNARRRIAASGTPGRDAARHPAPEVSRCVNGHGRSPFPSYSDYSKQFDGQLSPPAANARPHRSDGSVGAASVRRSRSLALDHS